jgi:hypothetical protein
MAQAIRIPPGYVFENGRKRKQGCKANFIENNLNANKEASLGRLAGTA